MSESLSDSLSEEKMSESSWYSLPKDTGRRAAQSLLAEKDHDGDSGVALDTSSSVGPLTDPDHSSFCVSLIRQKSG